MCTCNRSLQTWRMMTNNNNRYKSSPPSKPLQDTLCWNLQVFLETFCTRGATRTPRLTTTNMGWNQHVGDICITTTSTLCITIHLQISLAVELQDWSCS
jgi:hypothetical protein